MQRRFLLGLIGKDHRIQAIAERLAPESPFHAGPIRLAGWAAGQCSNERDSSSTGGAESQASHVVHIDPGLACDWRALVEDPTLDAICVGGPYAGRTPVVKEALAAGKVVMCALPAATTLDQMREMESAQGKGILVLPTDILHTVPGREVARAARAGHLGSLHSIYLAVRAKASDAGGDVLDEFGWEALDFVLTCAASPLERVYATATGLFAGSGARDVVLLNMRFRGDLIVTMELARCLPDALPAHSPDVEIEVAGASAAVRAEPYSQVVDIYASGRVPTHSRRSWQVSPVASMLEELARILQTRKNEPGIFSRHRALIDIMDLVRRSLSCKDALVATGIQY